MASSLPHLDEFVLDFDAEEEAQLQAHVLAPGLAQPTTSNTIPAPGSSVARPKFNPGTAAVRSLGRHQQRSSSPAPNVGRDGGRAGASTAGDPLNLHSELDALRREIARLEQQQKQGSGRAAPSAQGPARQQANGTAAARKVQKDAPASSSSGPASLEGRDGPVAGNGVRRPVPTHPPVAAANQRGPAAPQQPAKRARTLPPHVAELTTAAADAGAAVSRSAIAAAVATEAAAASSGATPATSDHVPLANERAGQQVGSKRAADGDAGGPASLQEWRQAKRLQQQQLKLQPKTKPKPQQQHGQQPKGHPPRLQVPATMTPAPPPMVVARQRRLPGTHFPAVPPPQKPPTSEQEVTAPPLVAGGLCEAEERPAGGTAEGTDDDGTAQAHGPLQRSGPGGPSNSSNQDGQAGPGPPKKRLRPTEQSPTASQSSAAASGGIPESVPVVSARESVAAGHGTGTVIATSSDGGVAAAVVPNESAVPARRVQPPRRAATRQPGRNVASAPNDARGPCSGQGASNTAGPARGEPCKLSVAAVVEDICPEAEQAATAFLMSFMTQMGGEGEQAVQQPAPSQWVPSAPGGPGQPPQRSVDDDTVQPGEQQEQQQQVQQQMQWDQQWSHPRGFAAQTQDLRQAHGLRSGGQECQVAGRNVGCGDGSMPMPTERLAHGPGAGGGGSSAARRAAVERTSAAVQRMRRKSSGAIAADPLLLTTTSSEADAAVTTEVAVAAATAGAVDNRVSSPQGGQANPAGIPAPTDSLQTMRERLVVASCGPSAGPLPQPDGQPHGSEGFTHTGLSPQLLATLSALVDAFPGTGTAAERVTGSVQYGIASNPNTSAVSDQPSEAPFVCGSNLPGAAGPLASAIGATEGGQVHGAAALAPIGDALAGGAQHNPFGAVASPQPTPRPGVGPPCVTPYAISRSLQQGGSAGGGSLGPGVSAHAQRPAASVHAPPWVQMQAGGWGSAPAPSPQPPPPQHQLQHQRQHQHRPQQHQHQLQQGPAVSVAATAPDVQLPPAAAAPVSHISTPASSTNPGNGLVGGTPMSMPPPIGPHMVPTLHHPPPRYAAIPPRGILPGQSQAGPQLPHPLQPPSHLPLPHPFAAAFGPGPPAGLAWRPGLPGGVPLAGGQAVVSFAEVDVLARKELLLLKWRMLQEMAAEVETDWRELCLVHNRLRVLSMPPQRHQQPGAAPQAGDRAVSGGPRGQAAETTQCAEATVSQQQHLKTHPQPPFQPHEQLVQQQQHPGSSAQQQQRYPGDSIPPPLATELPAAALSVAPIDRSANLAGNAASQAAFHGASNEAAVRPIANSQQELYPNAYDPQRNDQPQQQERQEGMAGRDPCSGRAYQPSQYIAHDTAPHRQHHHQRQNPQPQPAPADKPAAMTLPAHPQQPTGNAPLPARSQLAQQHPSQGQPAPGPPAAHGLPAQGHARGPAATSGTENVAGGSRSGPAQEPPWDERSHLPQRPGAQPGEPPGHRPGEATAAPAAPTPSRSGGVEQPARHVTVAGKGLPLPSRDHDQHQQLPARRRSNGANGGAACSDASGGGGGTRPTGAHTAPSGAQRVEGVAATAARRGPGSQDPSSSYSPPQPRVPPDNASGVSGGSGGPGQTRVWTPWDGAGMMGKGAQPGPVANGIQEAAPSAGTTTTAGDFGGIRDSGGVGVGIGAAGVVGHSGGATGGVGSDGGEGGGGGGGADGGGAGAAAFTGLSFKLQAPVGAGRRVGAMRVQQAVQTAAAVARLSTPRMQPPVSAVVPAPIVQLRRRSPAVAAGPAAAEPPLRVQFAPQVRATLARGGSPDGGAAHPQAQQALHPIGSSAGRSAGAGEATAAAAGPRLQLAPHARQGVVAAPVQPSSPRSEVLQRAAADAASQQQQAREQTPERSRSVQHRAPPALPISPQPTSSPPDPIAYQKQGFILSADVASGAGAPWSALEFMSTKYASPLGIFRSYRGGNPL